MEEVKADLIAECYIGFPKLLSEELMAFDIKDSLVFNTLMPQNPNASIMGKKSGSEKEFTNLNSKPFMGQDQEMEASLQNIPKSLMLAKRTKTFKEKLWYCGKCVGEISGVLTFYNLPILYQMKVGVLTKKGILFASRPILLDG
jgi:hypothetical protein